MIKKWNGGKGPIMGRIRDKLFGGRTLSSEEMFRATSKLETQLNRLRYLSSKLKARDKTLFEKCIEANVSGDQTRATLYATECAEIRKIIQSVVYCEAALERVILRLQTVSELKDIVAIMAPIPDVIQEIRGKMEGIIPSMADKLDEANAMLSDTIERIGGASITEFKAQLSEESARILDEAREEAEQRIRRRFPKLPVPIKAQETKTPVALTAGGSAYAPTSLEEQIYEYARSRNGRLNVPKLASELGVSVGDIERALLKLESEGRVAIG